MSKSTESDKLQLIDRATNDQLQHQPSGSGTINTGRITRSSKYKRTINDFNSIQFEKSRQHKYKGKRAGVLTKRSQKILQKSLDETAQQLEAPKNVAHSTKKSVRSRGYSYCDNCTTPRLAHLTEQLLREILRVQIWAYGQNEIKARVHRRFVVGFREVQHFLGFNKVKLVIIAPDCQEYVGDVDLRENITSIKAQCQSQQIPYAFTLRRRQLAYVLYKKVPVNCVAILDYDGAEQLFVELNEALTEAKQSFGLLQEQQAVPDVCKTL